MKKLLAILLALATILTISLTACGKDDNQEPDDPDGDLIDEPFTPGDSTDSGDEEPNDSQSGDDTEDTNNNTDVTVEFEAVSDTIYVLAPVANIRKGPSTSFEIVAQAKYEKALTRTGTNGTWNRIELNGETVYIQANLTTNNKNVITFEDVENKTVYVNVDEQMNLRTTPLYFDGYYDNVYLVDGKGLPRGAMLTLTGENVAGNWSRVEFSGKTYYCRPGNLSDTVPTDEPVDTDKASG